jgi:hypothetical protein
MDLPIDYDKSHSSVRKQAREQYITQQEGSCWFCKKSVFGKPSAAVMAKPINKRLFPHSMFLHPVHLHHDRKSGKTVGVVHARCSAYLRQYKGQ